VLLDGFTIAAQVLNFLVLVAVLKYVLYDRIIAAMEARERHISERIEEAERAKQEADREAATYRDKQGSLDEERERLLQEARQRAEERRAELTEEARSDVRELREHWLRTARGEQEEVLRELEERAGRQLCTISRQVLRDLADAALEEQAVRAALRRLRAGGELEDLAEKAWADGSALQIHTAFEHDDERVERLIEEVRAIVGDEPELAVSADPQLICGLEVRAAGRAVGWSIAGYLDELTREVARALPTEEG
jgi:F-type H+-transporting ATPase subunit b